MNPIYVDNISNFIHVIRGQRVMLDNNLAFLYQVETKYFNKSVQRNLSRFPDDFMFQLSQAEFENLDVYKSRTGRGGRRRPPYAFTEAGIAMLSSVLNNERAIQLNIEIIRIFIQLRNKLNLKDDAHARIDKLTSDTNKIFKIVFERFDDLEKDSGPSVSKNRKRIGLKK